MIHGRDARANSVDSLGSLPFYLRCDGRQSEGAATGRNVFDRNRSRPENRVFTDVHLGTHDASDPEHRALANSGLAGDLHARGDVRIVIDDHVVPDGGISTYDHVFAEDYIGADDRSRKNYGAGTNNSRWIDVCLMIEDANPASIRKLFRQRSAREVFTDGNHRWMIGVTAEIRDWTKDAHSLDLLPPLFRRIYQDPRHWYARSQQDRHHRFPVAARAQDQNAFLRFLIHVLPAVTGAFSVLSES